jgi:Flp pilus assembly protein TadB
MDDPRILWQSQEVEEMKFSVEELRAKAAKFQRRIWRRNLREYLAGLLAIVFFSVAFWNAKHIVPRIAFASLIAGAIFCVWYLRRWGSAMPLPANMGRADCVRFYRNELERQRDLLRTVWKWALGPIIPGVALLAIYSITSIGPAKWWQHVGYVFLEAAIFSTVVWLNVRAARRLDRRIAELEREMPVEEARAEVVASVGAIRRGC